MASSPAPSQYCIICSSPVPSVSKNDSSSSIFPPDSKLANIFIQCLTLDPEYLEDLQKEKSFCFRCKLRLEEWDHNQNQMVRFLTRARQLQASLIALMLQGLQLLAPDTCSKSESDSKVKLIRQSVSRRFNPLVLLEKLYHPSDLTERSEQICQDEEFSEDIEMEPGPLQSGDEGGSVESNDDRSSMQSNWEQEPPEEHIEKYRYAGVEITVVNGKHICGCCQESFEGNNSRLQCVRHILRCLRNKSKENSVSSRPLVRRAKLNSEPSVPLYQTSSLNQTSSLKSPSSPPDPTDTPPDFNSALVTQVQSGEYLYRNKIPFFYKNTRFTCGRCHSVWSSKRGVLQHLNTCIKRDGSWLNLYASSVEAPQPVRRGEPLKCYKSRKEQAAEKQPFKFQYFGVPVTSVRKNWTCGICEVTFQGFDALKRHIRSTPGHVCETEICKLAMSMPFQQIPKDAFSNQEPAIQVAAKFGRFGNEGVIGPDILGQSDEDGGREDNNGNAEVDPLEINQINPDPLGEATVGTVTEDLRR